MNKEDEMCVEEGRRRREWRGVEVMPWEQYNKQLYKMIFGSPSLSLSFFSFCFVCVVFLETIINKQHPNELCHPSIHTLCICQ